MLVNDACKDTLQTYTHKGHHRNAKMWMLTTHTSLLVHLTPSHPHLSPNLTHTPTHLSPLSQPHTLTPSPLSQPHTHSHPHLSPNLTPTLTSLPTSPTHPHTHTPLTPSHPPSPHLPRESDITKERIKKILDAGANVILCTGGIDDLCLKYFVEAGAMAVRRVKKEDLKRIARATGG